jgi:hypothetical protein
MSTSRLCKVKTASSSLYATLTKLHLHAHRPSRPMTLLAPSIFVLQHIVIFIAAFIIIFTYLSIPSFSSICTIFYFQTYVDRSGPRMHLTFVLHSLTTGLADMIILHRS